MQANIVINQPVWPFTGAMLPLTLRSEGVEYSNPVSELPVIPWSKVTDVEYLAENFRGLYVYEFQALCLGLAKALAARGLLESQE